MPGRVLIVDDRPSDRIMLKVKLSIACYGVLQAEDVDDALRLAREEGPCLVVLSADLGRPERAEGDHGGEPCVPAAAMAPAAGTLAGPSWVAPPAGEAPAPAMTAEALLHRLRRDPATASVPVIATTRGAPPAERLALFAAGADEVLVKPLNTLYLMARIRSLLRARDEMAELRLRESTSRVLGFAEGPVAFHPAGRVVLLTPNHDDGAGLRRALADHLSDQVSVMAPDALLSERGAAEPPDVILVDASGPRAGRQTMAILPELRARAESRHAAIIVLTESGRPARDGASGAPRGKGTQGGAALALDLGANDIVEVGADPAELALRVQKQMRWKLGRDRLRRTVAEGLNAAVTDPLTGLFNRRYALPHLARIVEASREGGRPFAVLLIDLDHFKAVNDTHGHAAGDAVLVAVAERLRENLRGKDLVARIGGEEFLVAMPDTALEEARIAAERLCGIMRDCPIPLPGGAQPIVVTTSIGLAMGGGDAGTDRKPPSARPEAAPDPAAATAPETPVDDAAEARRLMDLADRALYVAKAEGRAQVTVHLSAA